VKPEDALKSANEAIKAIIVKAGYKLPSAP
jgi:hypothetical protein